MNIWRWDQGRLAYFLFDNLREIAGCLTKLDGIEINIKDHDPLRIILEYETGLSFSPANYSVWRNYARVFGCSLLATKAGNHLLVSGICKKIADGTIVEVDDYLALLIQRFRYPSPVFENYNVSEQIVFPFIAILKFLNNKSFSGTSPFITVDEVFSFVIGNQCTGLEQGNRSYSKLLPASLQPIGDQERQVREMMSVLSQFSFLKWVNKRLYLDSTFDLDNFLSNLQPYLLPPLADRAEEFAMVSNWDGSFISSSLPKVFDSPVDLVFTEGKRTRSTHLKIERSPLLRKLFFEQQKQVRCDMCELTPKRRYPWTENILEIHHLLPLSSGISVKITGTSFADIVPLCPNCHRSIHIYYKVWLNANQSLDFSGKKEAVAVYSEAKKSIVL